jgi:hypothetical protein
MHSDAAIHRSVSIEPIPPLQSDEVEMLQEAELIEDPPKALPGTACYLREPTERVRLMRQRHTNSFGLGVCMINVGTICFSRNFVVSAFIFVCFARIDL